MKNNVVYWLISEDGKRTYVGSSNDIKRRIEEHKNKKVTSTKNFGKLKGCILEDFCSLVEARHREKYWKSAAGRKK